jgi:hypothetical protein
VRTAKPSTSMSSAPSGKRPTSPFNPVLTVAEMMGRVMVPMPSCLLGSRDAGLPLTSGLSERGSCSACLASQLPRQIARHARRLVNHDHCAQPHPRAGAAARFFAQLFGLDPSASARAVRQQLGIADTCSSCGPTRWVCAIATVARAYGENHRRSSSSMLSVLG